MYATFVNSMDAAASDSQYTGCGLHVLLTFCRMATKMFTINIHEGNKDWLKLVGLRGRVPFVFRFFFFLRFLSFFNFFNFLIN